MNDFVFIDLDGVILDSENRMLERKNSIGFCDHNDKKQFLQYFDYTNIHPEEWDYIIREANQINNSVEIIKELEVLKKKIAILTKVNTMYEMQVKVDDIRNHRKISCPIIFVPQGAEKHHVVNPNGQLLIDDFNKNVYRWIENGGKGYIFDESLERNENNKVKSLEFLLKRQYL